MKLVRREKAKPGTNNLTSYGSLDLSSLDNGTLMISEGKERRDTQEREKP